VKRPLTGLRAWMAQRMSAVYLLLFVSYLCLHFLFDPPASFEQWHEWVHRPAVNVASLVFFAALSVHMWVGLRDVILDYVQPTVLRASALALSGLGIAAMAAWTARILLLA
jgi:succinate dehydrogenase / fumarate reductase membrane anchor subunit